MPRLFLLAIAILPFALGAVVAGAQEPPRPSGAADATRTAGPREVRPRESLMQRPRDLRPPVRMERAPESSRNDGRSMSDAVRRVQRSTGGQILGAERVPFEGRDITRVKYMDGRGRVRYMDYVDYKDEPGAAAERRPPPRADNGGR
ncbi:hypothetical protein H1235_02890 [Pseudoxanthomonas sp. NC8]|nr:hypothetical protein H1235_02890 [Pseudoxanthomonas sp. NC8]